MEIVNEKMRPGGAGSDFKNLLQDYFYMAVILLLNHVMNRMFFDKWTSIMMKIHYTASCWHCKITENHKCVTNYDASIKKSDQTSLILMAIAYYEPFFIWTAVVAQWKAVCLVIRWSWVQCS